MSGRVALVTGGCGGIGRAVVARLAGAGARVAAADLATSDTPSEAVQFVELDVTDPASVRDAVDRVAAELGPIEVLVNCAGWDELKPFLDTDEAFWERVVAINYMGCLRVTHAVLPGMAERGFGRVVSIASDAGRVGSSGEAVYAGAKGGVIAFTKTIARELARRGVTANTVCPGPTDTPMLRTMAERGGQGAKLVEALERAVPMRRLATPADVAVAVGWFAGEDAGYITGQTLSVSGGLTMA